MTAANSPENQQEINSAPNQSPLLELPYFECYRDGGGDMQFLCALRIFQRAGNELAAFAASDREAGRLLHQLFDRFTGRTTRVKATPPPPPHLSTLLASLLAARPERNGAVRWAWMEQSVRDILHHDPTLSRKKLAQMLGVNREDMSMECINIHFKRAKNRMQMRLPNGRKSEGRIE